MIGKICHGNVGHASTIGTFTIDIVVGGAGYQFRVFGLADALAVGWSDGVRSVCAAIDLHVANIQCAVVCSTGTISYGLAVIHKLTINVFCFGNDRAAGDGDGAATGLNATADACTIFTALGGNTATGDGDDAGIIVNAVATAYACSIVTARGGNTAAVDDGGAAVSTITAADTRRPIVPPGLNATAVYGDGAIGFSVIAANAGGILCI